MRKTFISFLFLSIAPAVFANAANIGVCNVQGNPKKTANTKLAKAKYELAKKLYELGNYQKAYVCVKQALKLSPNYAEALQLKAQCEDELERIRQNAIQQYNDAVASENAEALQQFINTYPSSNLAKQASNRLQELKIWQQCKAQDTKQAYTAYLNQSQLKAYADEARRAIARIEEEERLLARRAEAKIRYEEVCKSNSQEEVEKFATDYHDTEYAEKVQPYICLLKARKAFAQNDLASAYTLYGQAEKATGESFTIVDKTQYAQAKEYSEYQELKGSENVERLQYFLGTYGKSSPYYAKVSDRIAMLRVNQLDAYTFTNSDLSEVRSYIQSESTRQNVESVISSLQSQRSAYERQQRTLARKRWWKDRVTLGWKVFGMDYMDEHFAMTTGLRLRCGRFTDFVNFLVTCDLNYTMVYDPNFSGYSSNRTNRFEGLAGYVEPAFGLRFNLGKRYNARFFMGAHAVRGFKFIDAKKLEKENHRKNTLAVMPEIGWSGRRFDFSIYYKYYLKGHTIYKQSAPSNATIEGKETTATETIDENYGNNRIGLSATWFF